MIFNRKIFPQFAATLPKVRAHFVAADLAKPGKQKRLTAIRPHFPHDDAHRSLDNLFRLGRIVVDPAQSEAEESGKVLFEEPVERSRVSLRHFGSETAVLLDLWDLIRQENYSRKTLPFFLEALRRKILRSMP
jgi:hypothetical protein